MLVVLLDGSDSPPLLQHTSIEPVGINWFFAASRWVCPASQETPALLRGGNKRENDKSLFVTDNSLQTLNFAFDGSSLAARFIIKCGVLRDAFKEMDPTAQAALLLLSKDSFRLSTKGDFGVITVSSVLFLGHENMENSRGSNSTNCENTTCTAYSCNINRYVVYITVHMLMIMNY